MKNWKSHKNKDRGVYEVYGQPGDGRICSIMNGSNEKKHAKLIAAAPELLFCLGLAMTAIKNKSDLTPAGYERIETVIAKATT